MTMISLWPPSLFVELEQPQALPAQTVAFILSRIQRFNGATAEPYSVAQHSILVSRLMTQETADAPLLLAGLLHDAEEVVFGDIATPLKEFLSLNTDPSPFAPWAAAIASGFGLDPDLLHHELVVKYDRRARDVERMSFRLAESAAEIGCEPLSLFEAFTCSKLPQDVKQTRSDWMKMFVALGGVGA
jgi:hypothetical protein